MITQGLIAVSYRIEYAPQAKWLLRKLTARQRAIVVRQVDQQLTYDPTATTRNRKPMQDSPVAPWVLRIGDLRVYYDVEEVPERVVRILAVGLKQRDRTVMGGEVFKS